MAWQLARLGDSAAAEQGYREYQAILTGTSPKSMTLHRQALEAAVNGAVRTKR